VPDRPGTAALFVAVSGPPASGKSTVAVPLAAELDLPLVAKDTIKDALMSVLPVPDVAASQLLGRAAVAAMFAVAGASPRGAVLDCNLHRSHALADLTALPGTVVEVFCRCDRATALARYRSRAGSRHPGHFDAIRDDRDIWHDDVANPVAGAWPLIELDTNEPVDLVAVLATICATLTDAGQSPVS
jgi:predicted kinase